MQKEEYFNMYESADYLWWYQSLREVISFYINQHALYSSSILDAGCGTGENMVYLRNLGYTRVTGIDLSREGLVLCKKRGLKNVKYGNISQLPFADNSFSAVYSTDVIGHLKTEERSKASAEFYRVLKPGGVLILQTAAHEWLRSQHDVVVQMQHRFKVEELKELFQDFQIQKISYRFFFLFPAMVLIKKIKRIDKEHVAKSDVGRPHPLVNATLLTIQRLENFLLRYINFPVGTSVFLVATKPK